MHKRFTRKTLFLAAAVTGMGMISVGCAITDYDGWLNHQTNAEARFWGSEISFITGDPALDGTYSYTAKYANGAAPHTGSEVTLFTYRNPVVSAFSRDGCVDRDGDDIQQRAGTIAFDCNAPVPAGKFAPMWRFGDNAVGCQFDLNYEQTFGSPKVLPPTMLCFGGGGNEEVDRDLELQAESFASLDDFFGRIWSGAVGKSFSASVASITFNGTAVPLSVPLDLGVRANGVRPTAVTVDLSSPGGQALIRAILANTTNHAATKIGVGFGGGMGISLPATMTIAFDHSVLTKLLH